jgi:hypothetical protein
MLKRFKSALVAFAAGLVFIPGCSKDTTVYLNNTAEVTTPVSLAKDMQPIFTKSCALSGCHAAGGKAPTLTDGSTYSSLINGNYVNTSKPEESVLYLWLTGKKTPAMPMGAANNPSNINALTLAWIKQGAKNN